MVISTILNFTSWNEKMTPTNRSFTFHYIKLFHPFSVPYYLRLKLFCICIHLLFHLLTHALGSKISSLDNNRKKNPSRSQPFLFFRCFSPSFFYVDYGARNAVQKTFGRSLGDNHRAINRATTRKIKDCILCPRKIWGFCVIVGGFCNRFVMAGI